MSESKHKFQKLTPKNDVELGIYEEAIEYAFQNDDVCNIALSGSYGAGKSSVLETYKINHPDKNFLTVSLAHFVNENADDKTGEMELEGKIINQLVHQIEPEQIPQTNFAMKRQVGTGKVLGYTAWIMVILLLLGFLLFHGTWCAMVNGLSISALKSFLTFTTAGEMRLVCGVICIVVGGFALYNLVKKQFNRNILRKINVKGSNLDIELFNGENDSYFDKYLNEIMYLLENAKVDAVVFEDIDRYDGNLIFEKLRELNTLLNRRIKKLSPKGGKEDSKPIRFIFLLKDDMFLTKDRTKFFDFIIPIVPVVDGSNSLDKFMELFDESGIKKLFDLDFLQGLSLYVDDMRILKNICNEFLVYYEKLQGAAMEPNNNKLLAMITYKNIFPKDFARLQVLEGYIYHLFDGKKEYRKNSEQMLLDKITELEAQIKEKKEKDAQEKLRSIDELDAVFYLEGQLMKVENKTAKEFPTRADYIAAIKKNDYNVSVASSSYYGGSYSWSKANVKAAFDALHQNPTYVERRNIIDGRVSRSTATEIERQESEVRKFRTELEKVHSAYLKELINKENEDTIFDAPRQEKVGGFESFSDIKKSTYFPLIKYLVSYGYIDETYPDYMTFFYANSISRRDKLFLRSITDRKAKEYNYELRDAEKLIPRIRIIDFEEETCWNYQLLDALLENPLRYKSQIQYFMKGMWNWEPAEFVEGYLQRGNHTRTFAEELNKYWSAACTWLLQKEFSEGVRKQYLVDTLCVSDSKVIQHYNSKGELTDYISKNADFLVAGINPADYDKILKGLDTLKVKFVDIHMDTADPQLLQMVYEKNLYALTQPMIFKLLSHMYKLGESEEYTSRNLTLIRSQEQPLKKYVEENLESYIKMQVEAGVKLEESAETLQYVLNASALENTLKLDYVKLMQTKLTQLTTIQDKTLWSSLLPNNMVCQQKIIFDYFFQSGSGMDEALVAYINAYPDELNLNTEKLDEDYGEKSKHTLFYDIMKTNEIEDEKYIKMLKSFNWYTDFFDTKDVQPSKMSLLIKKEILHMSQKTLAFLRVNYQNALKEYIEESPKEYIDVVAQEVEEGEDLQEKEVAYALAAQIEDAEKLRLLQMDTLPVSVMHKGYSEAIIVHILKNNLDDKEKTQLYLWYPQDMPLVQKEILRIAKEEVDEIVSSGAKLHKDLLRELLQDANIFLEDRQSLLTNTIPDLSVEETKESLRLLQQEIFDNFERFESLFEGKRPAFEMTETNEAMLEAFQARGWIHRYEIDKTDANKYRAYGKKPITFKIS